MTETTMVKRRRGEWRRRQGLARQDKTTRWRYSSGVTILNVHSWDLKSLAFQATTSSTSGGAIEQAIGYRPLGLERRGCQEPRHVRRDLVWNRDALRRDNKQSGFQPTCEPTGFQPVEHQSLINLRQPGQPKANKLL